MSYYYGSQHHQPTPAIHSASSHNHHGGRSRRAPRLSNSQNSHRQFRGVRSMKDLSESPPVSAFRRSFEAGRSFDLDDDMEFCPGLLTEDDVRTPKHANGHFPQPVELALTRIRYNQSTPPRLRVPFPVALLNRLRCNSKSSLISKSHPPSPCHPPPLISTTLRPASRPTIPIR